MTTFSKLLLSTAGSLPLPPMKSYAGVIKMLQRASVVVDRLEKENRTLRDNNNVVHIRHKGSCS